MYNLKAECRDKSVKAKKLRRNGIVPASIYGRNLEESILIQIPLVDTNRFLSTITKGSALTIELDDKKYNVLFKAIAYEPVSRQVEHIEFQHIVSDEAVNSVAKIILTNREKNQNLIQQHINEIPYNALPRNFVQDIVIDLDGITAGTTIKIEDLDIAKNEDIKLGLPEDTVVLTVAALKKLAVEEDEAQESVSDSI